MRSTTLALLCLFSFALNSQCFLPPSGSVLYSTDNVALYGTARTGFETLGPNLSGDWSVNGTSGSLSASFIDNSGRLSSISLSGVGQLSISSTVEDINTNNVTSCTQTFEVQTFTPLVIQNPSVASTCPVNVILVLDESGSIGDNMGVQTVVDATLSLANNLVGTGSRMAVVEFASTANKVMLGTSSDLQEVDNNYITLLSNYLSSSYNPTDDPTQLIGGTNWEDALLKASEISGADIIIMLTDGNPTFYNVPGGMAGSMGIAGEGDIFDLTALKNSQDIANTIKSSGTHILVAGLDFPSNANEQAIRDISGPIQLTSGASINDIFAADYTVIEPSELVGFFGSIGSLCSSTPPEPIPTLGEWSLICLLLLSMILGVVSLKQYNIRPVSR